MQIDGSGRVQLVQSMPVLRPDEQVLQLMLDGWRNQQLSRNLQFATIEQRLRCVQRFLGHVNEDPWNWTPATVEEFSADLRTVKHVSHSTQDRGRHIMKRKVDYTWRLAELMAARGLHNTTDLIPLLAERDIILSRPQVYRLVNQRPERMSLQVVAALCDIFECTPADLVTTTAADVRVRKTGTASPPNVVSLDRTVRPRRANILDE